MNEGERMEGEERGMSINNQNMDCMEQIKHTHLPKSIKINNWTLITTPTLF